MSELLSNDEIESLMEMVNAQSTAFDGPDTIAEIGASPLIHSAPVSPIDLLTPNRLTSVQIEKLEHMFAGTAQAIGGTMSDQLRYTIHCDCVAVDQTRFSNWAPIAADNAAVYVLNAPPLEIPIFFSVTKELLYGWVDRVLGGKGQVDTVPAEFSEAEFIIADGSLAPIFDCLVASMADIAKMVIEIEDRFTNHRRMQLLPLQNVVLAVHFQAGSDLLLGDLHLGIALSSLEPYLGCLTGGPDRFSYAPGAMRRELSDSVQPVDLNLSVELGSAEISMRDLLALQVGDVVSLEQRATDPVIAPVEGVPKFAGRIGTVGTNLGFRIESVLE